MNGSPVMLRISISSEQVQKIQENIDPVDFSLMNYLQMLSKRFSLVVESVQIISYVFELIKNGHVTWESAGNEHSINILNFSQENCSRKIYVRDVHRSMIKWHRKYARRNQLLHKKLFDYAI